MNDGHLKVKMTVESMQAQIMHYFSDYEKVLESLVKSELSEAKLVEAIRSEIELHLRFAIHDSLDRQVRNAVANSKKISSKIKKLVDEIAK